MKFNALVVAAMVITSVNAAEEGGFLSCFGINCVLSKSKKSEPKKGGGNGSNALEVNELICHGVVSVLKHSHDQMVEAVVSVQGQELVPPSLNDKADSLAERYDGARGKFVKYDCLTKYPDLLSQEELTEMDMLFYVGKYVSQA
ncbi:hypothetical protein BASA61_000802 [Batrachochytrium salamandrivorans]|nr:hypothetical protein BASA61_000802 [Batrachochytrium salamandrivorans]KAH9266989.1 hypothetical protein BASA83_010180 [Batrachochytrium salamandrivorans]